MKNFVNLIIKAVFYLLILYWLNPVFGRSTWTQTTITGLVLVLVNYIVGDLWILPKMGNWIAVVVDFGLTVLVLWIMMKALPQFVLKTSGVWIIALILAIGEWFYHLYLEKTQASGKKINSA